MTTPTQPAPTQTRHPWRAMFRTAAAVLIALAPVLPELVDKLGLSAYGWSGAVVGIAAVATRIMAIPTINNLLRTVLPFLATDPKAPAPPEYVSRLRG